MPTKFLIHLPTSTSSCVVIKFFKQCSKYGVTFRKVLELSIALGPPIQKLSPQPNPSIPFSLRAPVPACPIYKSSLLFQVLKNFSSFSVRI